jgi:hypothetical protein
VRRALLLLALTLPILSQEKTIFPTDTRPLAQLEDQEIIQTICPGHTEKSGKVDCGKNCPSNSGLDGGQHIMDWTLLRITRGHFLGATSEDAVVSTIGCEPHGSNYGGSLLVTRRAEKWRMIWYKPGADTAHCHKVQLKSSREILVCLGEINLQDNISTQLYVEDLLHPQGSLMATESHIFEVFDNTLPCAYYDETHTLKHAVIEKVDFADQAMSVTFSLGQRQMTPGATDACTAQPPRRSSFMPTMHQYRMDFVFDGQNYKTTPSSAALAKRLGLQ